MKILTSVTILALASSVALASPLSPTVLFGQNTTLGPAAQLKVPVSKLLPNVNYGVTCQFVNSNSTPIDLTVVRLNSSASQAPLMVLLNGRTFGRNVAVPASSKTAESTLNFSSIENYTVNMAPHEAAYIQNDDFNNSIKVISCEANPVIG
jgi:hypothetical protein